MSIMRNSKLPDAWVTEAIRANPFRRIIDPQTKQPLGSLTTCPARLSYPSIFKPEINRQTGQQGKYKATLLFPPGVDLGLLIEEYHAAVKRLFPGTPQNSDGSYAGLWSPFKDQGAKSTTDGYNPGAWAITVSTAYKPFVVDPAMNIVTDEARVYPGVWAIVAINSYKYGVSPPQPKKGIGFGMQTVMLIADDERLGGSGGLEPSRAFSAIKVQASFNAAEAFGNAPPPSNEPAPSGGFPLQSGGRPTGGQQGSFTTYALPGDAAAWEDDDTDPSSLR